MSLRGRAEAALAANTVVWGATFVLVKAALRDVSPILFLDLRPDFRRFQQEGRLFERQRRILLAQSRGEVHRLRRRRGLWRALSCSPDTFFKPSGCG